MVKKRESVSSSSSQVKTVTCLALLLFLCGKNREDNIPSGMSGIEQLATINRNSRNVLLLLTSISTTRQQYQNQHQTNSTPNIFHFLLLLLLCWFYERNAILCIELLSFIDFHFQRRLKLQTFHFLFYFQVTVAGKNM